MDLFDKFAERHNIKLAVTPALISSAVKGVAKMKGLPAAVKKVDAMATLKTRKALDTSGGGKRIWVNAKKLDTAATKYIGDPIYGRPYSSFN